MEDDAANSESPSLEAPASRGRPAFEPSEKDRRVVEAMSGWAIPQERIAKVVGVDPKTLRKHFAPELEIGSAKLEAQLAQNLLRIAQGHDRHALVATIFALKSRFGWVEATPAPRERDYPMGKKEREQLAASQIGDDVDWDEGPVPSDPRARFLAAMQRNNQRRDTAEEDSWEDILKPRQRN